MDLTFLGRWVACLIFAIGLVQLGVGAGVALGGLPQSTVGGILGGATAGEVIATGLTNVVAAAAFGAALRISRALSAVSGRRARAGGFP